MQQIRGLSSFSSYKKEKIIIVIMKQNYQMEPGKVH